MGATDDDRTGQVTAAASALVLAAGVFTGLFIISTAGQAVLAFLMLSVVPALLGYAGLRRTGYLPTVPNRDRSAGPAGADDDLLAELKRRYAAGEIDDAELERKVETLLAADGRQPAAGKPERRRERKRTGERARTREPEPPSP